jgi:hypothetical protein
MGYRFIGVLWLLKKYHLGKGWRFAYDNGSHEKRFPQRFNHHFIFKINYLRAKVLPSIHCSSSAVNALFYCAHKFS